MLEIKVCECSNPNAFWEHIKKIGPTNKKDNSVPWEVIVDGTLSTDPKLVHEKWKDAFEGIYQINNENFDDTFKKEKIIEIEELQKKALESKRFTKFNKQITCEEVSVAVKSSKLKKAVGLDMVPNELLKNNETVELIYELFKVCFNHQKIPDMWTKSVIHPITKETTKSNDPLKYRGLALQSCIYKIFSSIINKRLTD